MLDRQELDWRSGEVFQSIQQGQLKIKIGLSLPLKEAARAHDDLASRKTTGKVILIP